MGKIKVVYLKAGVDEQAKVIEISDEAGPESLQELYRLLNCEAIDIVYRKFGQNQYAVICDDEALLKKDGVLIRTLKKY